MHGKLAPWRSSSGGATSPWRWSAPAVRAPSCRRSTIERAGLVGLKVRPRGSPEDEGSLLSEARILLGMEPHPLLCRVLEDFFAGDRYFLVMDWVEGTTLADLLAEAGGEGLPLPTSCTTWPRSPRPSTTSIATGRRWSMATSSRPT